MGILFILSWLLATEFLCYLCLRSTMPILLKIVLIPLILGIEIIIMIGIGLVGVFYMELHFLMVGILIIQLLACTFYRIKYTFIWQLWIGALSFIGIAIYMYYSGSVIGELLYSISGDAGATVSKMNYNDYRYLTYSKDVLIPWFCLFNIVVSPFWLRNTKGQLLIKDLFRFDSCK